MKTKLFLTIVLALNTVYGFAQCVIHVSLGNGYAKCDTCFTFNADLWSSVGFCDTTNSSSFNYQWTFTGATAATDSGKTVTYCSQYIPMDSMFITCTWLIPAGLQTVTYANAVSNLLPDLGVNTTTQPICIITIDTAINKNMIVWEQTTDTTIISYNLYKETSITGVYNLVANIPRSSFSTYTDTTSQPDVKSARYYLTTMDSCNFSSSESPAGTSQKTMHLTVNTGIPPAWNLIWETYDGLPALKYRIWRNNTSTGWQLIDSVSSSSTTYSDLTPPAGLLSYFIEMISPNACNPSFKASSYNSSLSNMAYNNVTGINEPTDLSKVVGIKPNPFNQFTKIDLHLFANQNLKVVLTDMTGHVVMQYDNIKTNELIIPRNNLSQGLYFLEITGKDFYSRNKVAVN